MIKNKKLYLAAPLFSEAEKAYNIYLRDILSDFYDVYLPQEDGLLIVDLIKNGMGSTEAAKKVFENDVSAIESCDVLLILLDGRTVDEGAAFELGVAYSKRKKCIALQTDPRRLLEIGNNPMISQSISECFSTVNELVEWAKKYNGNIKGDSENANCVNIMCVKEKRKVVNC